MEHETDFVFVLFVDMLGFAGIVEESSEDDRKH
jgi:hypothetical protein